MAFNPITDDRLESIHLVVGGIVRRAGDKRLWAKINGESTVEAHELTCILYELKKRRGWGKRAHPFVTSGTTELLMSLKIGDSVEVEPIHRSNLSSARATARRKLNAQGIWRSEKLDNGMMRITRMQDGSNPRVPKTNPVTLRISQLRVGEFFDIHDTTGMTNRGYLADGQKLRARQLMGNLQANWKCERLSFGGLRCRRVT